MCDPGRLSHARVADLSDRLVEPLIRQGDRLVPIGWEEAVESAARTLEGMAGQVAAIGSPRMSNEDLWELSRLARAAGGAGIDFRADESWKSVDELVDGILIRRDPNPNTRGALAILGADGESGVGRILDGVAAGGTRGIVLCDWDPTVLGERGARALEAADWVLFLGPRAPASLDHIDMVLPTCVHVERDGTFTNYAGRVQRFWPNVSAHEASRPAWQALAAVAEALGGGEAPASAADSFAALAAAVPAFAGLSYAALGDQGAWLAGRETPQMPPVGFDPRPGVRAPIIV
jgi:predicted molibdopterin-dependent oxidoreductase YjgC